MSRSTISTFKLFELFPDEPSARKYLEGRLWPSGITCPECRSKERITTRKDGFYRCNPCKLDFTVRTKTIFETPTSFLRAVSTRRYQRHAEPTNVKTLAANEATRRIRALTPINELRAWGRTMLAKCAGYACQRAYRMRGITDPCKKAREVQARRRDANKRRMKELI
jgi:Transposase zinc-ribbon domain